MAEDIEKTNKPDVILNKKNKPVSEQKTEPKKKVRVIKKPVSEKPKKPEQNAEEKLSTSISKDMPKQVVSVKKADSQTVKPKVDSTKDGGKEIQKAAQQEEALQQNRPHSEKREEQKPQTAQTGEAKNNLPPKKEEKSGAQVNTGAPIDFLTKRPNVKAGNLADNPRKNHRDRGDRNTGKNQHLGGQGKRRESNFSGSQARAYSDSKKQNRSGQGLQNRGGKQDGRSQGKPMGFSGQRPAPAPIPVEKNKGQNNKKAYTKKKEIYSKKDKEDEFFEEKLLNQKKKQKEKIHNVPKQIEMMETISVSELAKKMNLKASELIGKLMGMGMMVTMNQSIDYDTAAILASEYECDVKIVSLYDETVIETKADELDELQPRPPVVTIMGHVDHGKTKTLDAIRSSNVAAGEFGGITQHIGAYTVNTKGGKITFLDTPGHEAFTMMRARGAEITDIVVLVVAADDGVMPQTIEAINHARAAKVPIIVAVNKVDKPEANIDKVKTRLSELGLMPEEWGGDTMFVEISALKKQGIDTLLETILLQAEVLELKANYGCNAEGKVIESRIDHGRGVVATIIVQRGTLRTGDPYVAGIYSGRVRAIFNDRGEKIDEASPSMPVEILGLEGMPNAGDPFQVTDSERIARQISDKRQELKRFEDSRNVKKVTLDNLYETIHEGEVLELKVIIKGDVQGSVEALKQSLEKLSTPEIRLNVIHASAGAINDSDVMLAAADSNAIIIGFNVRPTPQAKLLAEQEKVDIRKYTVIYTAVNEIKDAMEGMLSPDLKEQVIGTVEVRNTFKVPKIGKIAGCYVTDGTVKRNCTVHVIREGIVIHTGKISSLKRFKDDAKEVAAGFECGICIEDFNDIQVDDQLEVIEIIEIARKLSGSETYKAPEIPQEEIHNE
ncbi:translation initiation factor IF-2 [Treponema pedis]|uniref:translation initiation factor IF-2 n=1 Tax=Treponema pedis TaxID=409322 RepID=UPI003133DE81